MTDTERFNWLQENGVTGDVADWLISLDQRISALQTEAREPSPTVDIKVDAIDGAAFSSFMTNAVSEGSGSRLRGVFARSLGIR